MSELWREMVDNLRTNMGRRHPYLRAVCSFLHAHSAAHHSQRFGGAPGASDLGEGDMMAHSDDGITHLWKRSPYLWVLAESGVALSDRIAFACRFLPDIEVRTARMVWVVWLWRC